MRNRPLFIVVCIVLFSFCSAGLFAEESEGEKVKLPDSPLVEEKEKESPAAGEGEPSAEVKPTVAFLSPNTLYMGLHAGASFGLGGFPEPMGVGYELFFSVRYQITPNISALAAVSMFALGTADGGSGIGFYHFSLDGRYHVLFGDKFYGYVQLGGSGYTADFTGLDFGFNVGAGAAWMALSDMSLDLGVDYNATFEMENMFLQAYVGAVFKM